MNFPWRYTAQRQNIVVKRFTVSHDPAESLRSIEELITPRTRLIGSSHVTSPYGIRLPAREICELAHAHGALAFIDGAQSFAVTPIDVQAIGCDFFTSNCHKWLGGPKGTGFLYARQELTWSSYTRPTSVLARRRATTSRKASSSSPTARSSWHPRLRGARQHRSRPGLVDALGWENVFERIEFLSTRLKRQIVESGVELCTPMSTSAPAA